MYKSLCFFQHAHVQAHRLHVGGASVVGAGAVELLLCGVQVKVPRWVKSSTIMPDLDLRYIGTSTRRSKDLGYRSYRSALLYKMGGRLQADDPRCRNVRPRSSAYG